MADTLTKAERSERMRLIRSRDTTPEKFVRKMLHGMGFRYRLHARTLPGRPDLVFAGRRKVIFVHGCFWHRHANCKLARLPKSRLEYWLPKLSANKERDEKNRRALGRLGWRSLVVWECQLSRPEVLARRLARFLNC